MRGMDDLSQIRQEALVAARAAAFTIGDEYEGAGRRVIHCRLGGIGADWDLSAVEDLIEHADSIEWARSIFGHDLAVGADGKWYCFDVHQPAAEGSRA